MRIVVDSNIVFSAILNTNGKIGDLLLNSEETLQFFACDFLKSELEEHHQKLKAISKLSDLEINQSKEKIFQHITFVDTRIIPLATFQFAEALASDIDPDDTEHVAFFVFLEGILWTGDKKLHSGLHSKGINSVVNTDELWALRTSLESETK